LAVIQGDGNFRDRVYRVGAHSFSAAAVISAIELIKPNP
jgi:hypothetical protein